MKPNIKHWPVNWIDGMKINQNHFIQNENSAMDLYRDAVSVSLTSFNFGLLPPDDTAFHLQTLISQPGYIQVRLNKCRAVTAGGARIEYTPPANEGKHYLVAELKEPPKNEALFLVIITADLFNRMPWGNPDPNEVPLRHPYAMPNYSLSILPASQYNADEAFANSMVIGKIKWSANDLVLDADFIPASSCLSSHPRLLASNKKLSELSLELEMYAAKIYQKVIAKNQKTSLAENTRLLMGKFLDHLASAAFMKRHSENLAPLMLVNSYTTLANVFRVFLTLLNDKEKEEMITYYSNWTSQQEGKLESMISITANLNYYHPDALPSIHAIESFMVTIHTLLGKLSNLEMIGSPPQGSEWLIQEKTKPTEQPKKTGWSTF